MSATISRPEARQAQRFAKQPVGRFTAKGEQDRRYVPAAAPDRSLQQRREALAKGNEHRTKRAALKCEIAAGRKRIGDVLLEKPVPEWAATMKVSDLLRSVPGVGKVKVGKTLRALTISHSKTLAGLSDRQRSELAGRMAADEARREQRRVAA